MKAARASFCPAALILAALLPASLPSAHAEDDPAVRVAIEKVLTFGSWTITYQKGWTLVRVFNRDGTFSSPGRPDESGRWEIANKTVIQTYADGRKDVLSMPVDEKDLTGTAKDGETMSAVHNKTGPGPASALAGAAALQGANTITDVLTSAPWKVNGTGWSNVRVFAKDGTFSTEKRPRQHGNWTIDGDVITLTFVDGHKDLMKLPLDPKSTVYLDQNGAPGTAVRQLDAAAANNAPSGPVQSSPFGTTAPGPQKAPPTFQDVLLSGPWRLTTKAWSDVRVFAKDGTFTTVNRPGRDGKWMVTNDFVILMLPNGHKDAIYLPLNPKGSKGLSDDGGEMTAVQENPGATGGTTAPAATQTVAAGGTQAAPAPQAGDLLVSGPWKITGADGARIRTFEKGGTFATAGHDDEYGWWKTVNDIIILTFADGRKESLKLPLDPKGTGGLGKDGSPLTAVLQTAAGPR